tara:strand:+ start:933 stop:1178 length:246 start_codon:yes stop_codon:yes gene_type:complete
MDNYKLIKNNDLNKFQYLCNDLLDNDYRLYGDLKIINSNKEDFYIQSFIKNSLINTDKIQINNNKYIKNKLTDNYHWSDWE